MCNGYRHPPGCGCGWGRGWSSGGGYSGRGAWFKTRAPKINVVPMPSWLTSAIPRGTGFTNPNASCPVCGVNVFFYESPYGGRVFFDALGPPWPKHPCTDSSNSGSIVPEPPLQASRPHFEWQDQGWSPFKICELSAEVAGLDGTYFTIVRGECEGVELVLHVIEPSLYEKLTEDVSEIFAHTRFEDDGHVSISFLDVKAKEFCVAGFFRLSEAKREYEIRLHGGRERVAPARQKTAIGKALEDAMRRSGGSKKG